MVGEILKARLDAPIIFTGDEDKAVSAADFAGELLQGWRCLAARIFLVHAVEHRQAAPTGWASGWRNSSSKVFAHAGMTSR
jgi:hypothetical protein